MSNYIYSAPTGDGWLNLARDGYFLENNKKGDVILYFYVNKKPLLSAETKMHGRNAALQTWMRTVFSLCAGIPAAAQSFMITAILIFRSSRMKNTMI